MIQNVCALITSSWEDRYINTYPSTMARTFYCSQIYRMRPCVGCLVSHCRWCDRIMKLMKCFSY